MPIRMLFRTRLKQQREEVLGFRPYVDTAMNGMRGRREETHF